MNSTDNNNTEKQNEENNMWESDAWESDTKKSEKEKPNAFDEAVLYDAYWNNDPYVFYPTQSNTSEPHPSYFNPLDIDNFYEQCVPVFFQRFTTVPDSLLNAFTYFNLDRVCILILLAAHKNTLGFLHPQGEEKYKSDRVIRTRKFPANKIAYQYGSEYKPKNTKLRSRFIKTTIRDLAEAINSTKSTVYRKIQKLQELKLIQVDSNKHNGTILGINYLTIESICGGKQVAFQIRSPKKRKPKNENFTCNKSYMESNVDAKLVEKEKRFITRILTSIEQVTKLYKDNNYTKITDDKYHTYYHMLGKVFFRNHFLKKQFSFLT